MHADSQVMDKHMSILSKSHLETKFVKVSPLALVTFMGEGKDYGPAGEQGLGGRGRFA